MDAVTCKAVRVYIHLLRLRQQATEAERYWRELRDQIPVEDHAELRRVVAVLDEVYEEKTHGS
jgi:hypothetical protein